MPTRGALEGRIAVVTGGNRGLGLATCRELARLGARVVLGTRDMSKGTQAAQKLLEEGLQVTPVVVDVSQDESVEAMLRHLDDEGLRVDILVNNAGAIFEASGASTFEVPAAVVAQAFATNALGAYRLIQRILPEMNRRNHGRIVNVSSGMGALTDMDGRWPAYRISKTALLAITRIFHAEAETNVKVNAVCPGWVRTDMGGASATRSLQEGVKGIVWAATLPDDGPSGGFFRDGKPIDW